MTADDRLTDADLAAIEARAAAATDGPWTVYVNEHGPWVGKDGGAEIGDDPAQDAADAEFSAHARTDVPRLVAALRAVEALCAEARAGLSIPPIDCTGSCSDGPCDCSGVFRVRAWDLDPDRIRTAIRDALDPA